MARYLTPHQIFLAPLAKLALRHPMLEGQAIWWEAGDWQAQDDEEAMIDGEEIAYYAEGLLAEGFGLHWQVLAEADAPVDSGGRGILLLARIDKLLAMGALDQAAALAELAGPAIARAPVSRLRNQPVEPIPVETMMPLDE